VNKQTIHRVLEDVRDGRVDVSAAAERLAGLPYENIDFARVDHHREIRTGFPEVIFGQGKTPDQIVGIAERIVANGSNLLISRTTEEVYRRVAVVAPDAQFHAEARMITAVREWEDRGSGTVAIVSAGTSDIPVAEEAAVTAYSLGNRVTRIYDVGVAGIHRLFGELASFESATAIIAVAGMEGALPSVVGGLVGVPVIAVPTSIGYGASFGGIAALLGMLNSCASNVTVVNIDNGFGAGVVASLINRRRD
jgi:pyridinium-3,5-biscarboxylic acid mononucleotide synthase